MSMFKHLVRVLDAGGTEIEVMDAWVDTGSTYSWLPREVFARLGLEPTEEREFILANGRRENRRVAQIRISLGGPAFYTYCAVAEPEEESLLGAVALEEAGLAVDGVNKRLVRAAGYALTAIDLRP